MQILVLFPFFFFLLCYKWVKMKACMSKWYKLSTSYISRVTDIWIYSLSCTLSYLLVYMCGCVTVGGIYTVIKTKAPITVEEWGEQYCLMGPYNEACVRTEVEILEPHHYVYRDTIQTLRQAGIKVCECYHLCWRGR